MYLFSETRILIIVVNDAYWISNLVKTFHEENTAKNFNTMEILEINLLCKKTYELAK